MQMDDKASQFIPQLPETWQEITILQLLRHASGLSDYRASAGFDLFRQWSFQDLVDLVAEEPLQFVPGSSVMQSATNFLLLTEVLERVSGKSYHDFVTERQIKSLQSQAGSFTSIAGSWTSRAPSPAIRCFSAVSPIQRSWSVSR